jgi:hypothetical protein
MSTEGCKLGVIEMLGKTKMGKSKVDELFSVYSAQ